MADLPQSHLLHMTSFLQLDDQLINIRQDDTSLPGWRIFDAQYFNTSSCIHTQVFWTYFFYWFLFGFL